jgi:hypothetical protein
MLSENMQKIILILASTYFSVASIGQYCTAVGPSSTADSNIESILLNGDSGAINYIGCPPVIGLEDLTAQGTTLSAGSNYSISVQFGTCGGNYLGSGTVWIDFNLDENFEPSEIIGTWSGTPPVALSVFNFSVPVGAQNGLTRMRVSQQEAGILPLDPCASYTWGSVVDFSINIQNGIDCSGYPGDDELDAILVSAFPFADTRSNSYCYTNQNQVYSSPDVFYKLMPNPTILQVTASLCGSSFDTFLSVIDTAGNVIVYNDDFNGCGSSSQVTFSTLNLGPLYIVVEGWDADTGTFVLNLTASSLGIEAMETDVVQVYPNPASEYVTIAGYNGLLEIVDLSGKTLKSLEVTKDGKVDLTYLSSGVYVLFFKNGAVNFTKRLIVNR